MMIVVYKNKEQFGPFSASQVQDYVDKGVFKLTDYCWTEGWSEWKIIANFASRTPVLEKDTTKKSGSETKPEKGEDLATASSNLITCNGIGSSKQKTKPESNFIQNGGAIDCHRLTSMASFGFIAPKIVANNQEQASPKDINEKMVHLARAGEIFDKCRISEIPKKIASGYLNSNDLWFNETNSQWESLSKFPA
jgi:hypothetical protein